MSFSERKEFKTDPSSEGLRPFYKTPAELLKPYKVEIDDFSARIINDGNSEALNLFDDKVKASLGQRYVVIAFIKNGVAHLRAIPGFEHIKDKTKEKKLAEKAAKFFKCKPEDIAFPGHAIWTGVVHRQLKNKIKKEEPDIEKDARLVAMSMMKLNNKFYWRNRSMYNTDEFEPDPLATACYMFEAKKDYAEFKPGKFDLFYHLQRSIPEEFFANFTDAATETICKATAKFGDKYFNPPATRTSTDDCLNFPYEHAWNTIRELYLKNKAKAVKQIQHMLMRNLYIYLTDKCAAEYRARALRILYNGFIAAEKYGIPIDINFIPPEFKGHDYALKIAAKNSKNLEILNFLIYFKTRNTFANLNMMTDIFVKNFIKDFSNIEIKESKDGWIPYDDSLIQKISEILKKSTIPIKAENIFEKKDHGKFVRLSTQLLKQEFWQSCRREGQFVDPSSWVEDNTIFENYKIIRCDPLLIHPNMLWLQAKESKDEKAISFAELPPEEQRRYFIHSTLKYSTPDYFKLLHPSPEFSDVFKTKEDLKNFAKTIEEENQIFNHIELLKSILKDYPDRFLTILTALSWDNILKILDTVEANFSLLHPNDPQHKIILKIHELAAKQSDKISQNLVKHFNQATETFNQFQRENKLDPKINPISFEALREYTTSYFRPSKSCEQEIFKMYLQHYFPGAYGNMLKNKNSDFMTEFSLYYHVCNGPFGTEHMRILIQFREFNETKPDLSRLLKEIRLRDGSDKLLYIWLNLCHNRQLQTDLYREILHKYSDSDPNQTLKGYQGSLLYYAVALNQKDEVILLLKDTKINVNNDHGDTLFAACRIGNTEIVQALLDRGAVIPDGLLAMMCHCNQFDMVKILLAHGANPNDLAQKLDLPLIEAANNGNLEMVNLLIAHGADVNLFHNDSTPLIAAIRVNNAPIVEALLNAGANPTLMYKDRYDTIYRPYELAIDPIIKHVLFCAHLDMEIKHLQRNMEVQKTPESKFFVAKDTQQTLIAAQKLKEYLETKPSKEGFEKLTAEHGKILNQEPWKNFYKHAMDISHVGFMKRLFS